MNDNGILYHQSMMIMLNGTCGPRRAASVKLRARDDAYTPHHHESQILPPIYHHY